MNFHTTHFRRNLLGLLAIVFTLSFVSCSKKVRFLNSSVVPAAVGKVKISKNDNGNYQLELNIVNLAEPAKLTPAKKYYVVWMLTDNDGLKNLGQLISSSGYFSSLLKAEMRTSTPFKPKKVFITAENSTLVETPSTAVFTTDSF